jgi:hypothetical protein
MIYDPPTPVERVRARKRWIRWLAVLGAVLAVLYYVIFVNQYVVAFRDNLDHFKYGSIGSEPNDGIPILVFKALPVMYPDGSDLTGYRRFGMLYESDQAELPIGVSRRIVDGVERVWLNCAVCHVGTYRIKITEQPKFIWAGSSNNLRLYDFIRFLIKVGRDPQFTADNLIDAINSKKVGGNLNFVQRLIYRYVVFPRVREALLLLSQQLSFVERQHNWGPGRVDTFNPYKAIQFHFPMDASHISDAELNASADFPSIWQQRPRQGMHLHWDGNNTSVDERNLSAALGAGVTPVTVDIAAIKRVRNWIWDWPAPPFPVPLPTTEDERQKLDRGRQRFAEYCAGCHGMKNNTGELSKDTPYNRDTPYDYDTNHFPHLGQVEKLDKIGTDRDRWESYTQNFSAAQNTLYAGYPWRFTHFSKTAGYANQPLDGIWARSPYLHNGSVPTLRDLLEPSVCQAEIPCRPAEWHRGSDILDTDKVGYQSDGSGYNREDLFFYDTSAPGNSNKGHEGKEFGTELPRDDKDAIVEYMKTL